MVTRKLTILIFLLVAIVGNVFSATTKCELSGTVKDSLSGDGLAFASVQLTSLADTIFNMGAVTNIDGAFIISDIPFGKYKLLASYMGYEQQELTVDIREKKMELNIGLAKKDFTLSEVEVTAEKQLVEQSLEKTTINVSKNTTLTGGTAIDVMQTLPSVDFDINGNLQYRGSDKVTLLLNGEKSELVKSLDQIPADQIKKIELINNPSAKYDAQGMSGIINIVLKSGNEGKSNSSVMLYGGYPETMGGNAGYSGNKENSRFFVNGGINHKTKFQTKEHFRDNYGNTDADNYYQYDNQDQILNDAFINANYAYAISEKQKIDLSLVGSTMFNTANRDIQYQTLDDSGMVIYEAYKEIDISLDNFTIDGNVNYKYDFDKNGQLLKANLHYTMLDQLQQMDNAYYPELSLVNPELQNTFSKQLNKQTDFSLDYSHPVSETVVFETGYNFDAKNLLNDFTSKSYNYQTSGWEDDTALDNRFNYLQNINAVYFNLIAGVKSFEVQAGLRGEYTRNEQNDLNKDEYFNLFPSINISKQVSEHFNVFVAYNRRINRPTIHMLNPFTDEYADILNMHVGNPDLKPEFVNSFEAGNRFVFDKISGSGSVYFRNIDQAISRVKSASNDSALVVTFMNLDNAKLFGGELALSYKPFSWWNINAGGNVFYTHLVGEYGPNEINRKQTGWTASIANNFKLPAGFGFQLNGYYRSKLPDVMGTYMERYYIDLALNKNILKGKGKLIFKISDVFNTYRYGLDLDAIDENGYRYSQRNRRKNESQYFILSFVYNIDGKEKQKNKSNFYLDSFEK
jgi:outer membrane receptor protein involved in Fe transport